MKISCLSIDLINPDKPAASLAFLCGICEHLGADYQAISINARILRRVSQDDYNRVYNAIKLENVDLVKDTAGELLVDIAEEIAAYQPDYVLVSVFSYMQYLLAQEMLSALRSKTTVKIIAGGPGIQFKDSKNITNGKKLLEQGLLDFYVLGEGDEILPRFLNGERDMLGLNCAEDPFESWVPQINDLDQFYITPSYKKIDLDVYHNLENKDKAVISVSTSRGCVRDCSFCDVAKSWPKYRFRSGKKVADEILAIHLDSGTVNFTIVDSLINGSLKSFREFNREMIRLKQEYPSLAGFSYNGMFIVRDERSHDDSFFQEMAAAGCESLALGIETGSDRLRFDMNKKFTNQDLDHHLLMSQKYGIKNNFLMFVGYPTETEEDFQQTLIMLERYQHYLIDGTIIGINHTGTFNMLTDTPVYEDHTRLGIVVDQDIDNRILRWDNPNNPSVAPKNRVLRDLRFRERAAELRYPVPYSDRYLMYLKDIDPSFIPVSD